MHPRGLHRAVARAVGATVAAVMLVALVACAPTPPAAPWVAPSSPRESTDASPALTEPTPAPAASTSADGIVHDLDYVGDGNRAQTLDLYLPTARTDPGPAPIVVFVHGGGWSSGSKDALTDERAGGIVRLVERLRASGYAVAGVNYRLSGEASWPAPLFDVKLAIAYLRKTAIQHGLDGFRIAVAGESSGGHLAMMAGLTSGVDDLRPPGLVAHTSARVSAVISYYGVTDLRTLPAERAEHGCPPQSMPGDPTLEGTMLGVEPSTAEGELMGAKASPISYPVADAPPLLLLHGTKDCTVVDDQSIRMDAAMRGVGASSRLILVDANHAWPTFYIESDLQQAVLDHLAAAFAH